MLGRYTGGYCEGSDLVKAEILLAQGLGWISVAVLVSHAVVVAIGRAGVGCGGTCRTASHSAGKPREEWVGGDNLPSFSHDSGEEFGSV